MDAFLAVVQTNEFWHAMEALLAVAALFVPNAYAVRVAKILMFLKKKTN